MSALRTGLVVAVLFLGGAIPVAGSARTPKEEARALFHMGNRHFARGEYGAALKKFRQARALFPSFKIDLNIGSTLNAMGRLTEAAEYYERFLRRARGKASPAIMQAARASLEKLRRRLASIEVFCAVRDAVVLVSGRTVGRTPLEMRIYLKPGKHRLSLKKKGYAPSLLKVTLGAGKHRTFNVRLRPGKRSLDKGAAKTEMKARRSKTIWAYTTMGTGLALAVSAGVLYGVGLSQGDAAHDSYLASNEPDKIRLYRQDLESAETKVIVGHVLAGTAAVALAVSIYQFVTRSPAREEGSPQRGRTTVGIVPSRDGAMLGIGGLF